MVNPQTMPMNREQRRAHYRESKNDPKSMFCPRCNHKTRHIALPENKDRIGPEETEMEEPVSEKIPCIVVCAACGNILRTHVNAVPYEYVVSEML